MYFKNIVLEKEPKFLLKTHRIGNLFSSTISKNESVRQATKERILHLMKYNDIEQYEVKSMLRKNQNDDEKNKGSKRRDSKSLDEIRKWVHNLAKDNRVRVNEHYSQVSRENRLSTEPEPTNLELPEEMRRIMMRRKEESLPPIKSERGTTATKRASILSSHSVVGVRPPELKLERLTLDGISFKASRSSTVRGRIQGRQAAIIPMKATTDSFEVERVRDFNGGLSW